MQRAAKFVLSGLAQRVNTAAQLQALACLPGSLQAQRHASYARLLQGIQKSSFSTAAGPLPVRAITLPGTWGSLVHIWSLRAASTSPLQHANVPGDHGFHDAGMEDKLRSAELAKTQLRPSDSRERKEEAVAAKEAVAEQTGGPGRDLAAVASYWHIEPKTYAREDGRPWPWRSFRPGETYAADTTIDLKKHHVPTTFSDRVAYRVVKLLRIPTDLLFQKRYGCRAMMLETVAAVPGMVGGMLLHLKSLRRFEQSGGWIKALLDEAENERMHLMTFMEVAKPKWWERMLVLATQGVFFNCFFVLYLASPRIAHRVVGYLEEEAIHSYTSFLEAIDAGHIENTPAPRIAIDYWRLPEDATLRDVVLVVRADEAHHRDVNHFASEIKKQKKELNQYPAPIEYH